jgi:hypothetical protein
MIAADAVAATFIKWKKNIQYSKTFFLRQSTINFTIMRSQLLPEIERNFLQKGKLLHCEMMSGVPVILSIFIP